MHDWHPITMFTVAVLIVIAIGVGVVAATRTRRCTDLPGAGSQRRSLGLCGEPAVTDTAQIGYVHRDIAYLLRDIDEPYPQSCAIDWTIRAGQYPEQLWTRSRCTAR